MKDCPKCKSDTAYISYSPSLDRITLGYVVECLECGLRTESQDDRKEAERLWDSEKVFKEGVTLDYDHFKKFPRNAPDKQSTKGNRNRKMNWVVVSDILKLHKKGKTTLEIVKEIGSFASYITVRNICRNITWMKYREKYLHLVETDPKFVELEKSGKQTYTFPRSKVTPEDVINIRKWRGEGLSGKEIRSKINGKISVVQINKIANGTAFGGLK